MICQECKKAVATVHLTEISGNQSAEVHMCENCAKTKGLVIDSPKVDSSSQISWIDLIASAIGDQEHKSGEDAPNLSCPVCGITYAEFRASGRLGCPNDYAAFQSTLVPLLEKIHHGVRHSGKRPGWAGKEAPEADHLADLNEKLQAAIQREEFEKAAEIRDSIRDIEERGK